MLTEHGSLGNQVFEVIKPSLVIKLSLVAIPSFVIEQLVASLVTIDTDYHNLFVVIASAVAYHPHLLVVTKLVVISLVIAKQ